MLDLFAPSIQQLQSLGIRYTIRENRIAGNVESASDKRASNISSAMKNKDELRKRHAEWKALFAIGKTPQEIADEYGVYASTVRRVTGGSFNRPGRKCRAIKIGKKTYRSQIDAMRELHIARETLMQWLSTGKAKYV